MLAAMAELMLTAVEGRFCTVFAVGGSSKKYRLKSGRMEQVRWDWIMIPWTGGGGPTVVKVGA